METIFVKSEPNYDEDLQWQPNQNHFPNRNIKVSGKIITERSSKSYHSAKS